MTGAPAGRKRASTATSLDVAREEGMDLIAMATRGHGPVRRAMLGSVADKVLRGASTAVLLYHPRMERELGA